jgi:hypothetical protein
MRPKKGHRLGKGFRCIFFKMRLDKIEYTKRDKKKDKYHIQFVSVQDMIRVYHKDEDSE